MRIKLSIPFIDGLALKDAIHKECMREVMDRFPDVPNLTDEQLELLQEDRGACYDNLYAAAEDCVRHLKAKTFAEIELNERDQTARIVGVE